MSQLSSTAIDDAELLDQLRFFGEPNLPLLPTGATSTLKRSKKAGTKSNYLNDSNRDIYLKKLNHYKAREKIETNPSKEYLRTKQENAVDIKRISNIFKVESNFEEEDDDIIELDKTEYAPMVDGGTSPLSMSDYEMNASGINYALSSTRAPSLGLGSARSPQVKSPDEQKANFGYVKLKDRIKIDETLDKYRMDIENILHQSMTRNRLTNGTAAQHYLNDEVLNNYKKSTDANKIMYCPKAEPKIVEEDTSFFGSLKSKFYNNDPKPARLNQRQMDKYEGIRRRQDLSKDLKELPPLPSKDPKGSRSIISLFFRFISYIGLQIAKFLPYLVMIIVTIVALQYMHLKFVKNDGLGGSTIEEGKVYVEQILETVTPSVQVPVEPNVLYCSDIKDTKCSGTKALLRELIDYLRHRSGQVDCSAMTTKPNQPDHHARINLVDKSVHLNEIIEYLVEKRSLLSNIQSTKALAMESILGAIAKNPHWEILLLDETYSEVNGPDNVTYLVSKVSSKSLMCRLRELVYFIYVRALIFGMAVIAVVLAYFCFSIYKKNRAARDKEYFDLITRVTSMVEKQYELSMLDPVNIKPYIAISHIYDTLVDPSERAKKKKLWNKIVEFIQDHESRIHLETQFIHGEETHVWKWIGVKQMNLVNKYNEQGSMGLANSTMVPQDTLKSTNSHKVISEGSMHDNINMSKEQLNGWQGSAFNRTEKLSCSPTPCLKIRNMFDLEAYETDPFLPIKIHNSVLEKCTTDGVNKKILHIACDKKSKEGCVYVKCATNDVAGVVYQALNGTWYNGKLLNVKFLRSDRFAERFPESIGANQPVRPLRV